MYSLGPSEFYVDVAMPFGKANSSKKFCAWTDLWFASFLSHFRRTVPFHAVLGSYVDDAFGGARTRAQAQLMVNTLTSVGLATATILNPKKTRGPATSLVILGLLYCSKTKTCRLGEDKQSKYLARIVAMVGSTSTSSKELEKLTGNLGFAAWVEPFCRPLLSCLYSAVVSDDPAARVPITHLMRSALSV